MQDSKIHFTAKGYKAAELGNRLRSWWFKRADDLGDYSQLQALKELDVKSPALEKLHTQARYQKPIAWAWFAMKEPAALVSGI